MKTTILTYAISGIMIMTGLVAFGQEARKPVETRKDLIAVQNDLIETKIDSVADFQKFKEDAMFKLTENENKIGALREKSWNENLGTELKYNKKVIILQQKNNDLKKKIKESDGSKPGHWSSFRHEFNHDMNELGHAIKDMEVGHIK